MSQTSPEQDKKDGVFAVVGATGQQGGAVARALLKKGATVHALTRDPDSAAARALAEQGAKLVRADLGDSVSLRKAFAGVDGVFAMTTFAGERGTDGEVEDGKAIADAALAAGVPHLLYSSVGGAERHTGIPHFESKRRVEEHIETLGLHATFVRPTFFMENLTSLFTPKVEEGILVLRMPLPENVPLQMVAVADIGEVASAVLLDPGRVPNGSVEIAGDELTGEQIATTFAEHAGLAARYQALPLDVLADNPDQQAMFAWFAQPPAYRADFAQIKMLSPHVLSLKDWLTEQASVSN